MWEVRTQAVQIDAGRAGQGAEGKYVRGARQKLNNLRAANKHKLCKGGRLLINLVGAVGWVCVGGG